MGEMTAADFQKPAITLKSVEAPSMGVAVFEDQARFRDGDLLPPGEQRVSDVKLPTALRGIELSKITSRPELMAALTVGLPVNEYHMPKFIYRPDLLDADLFSGDVKGDPDLQDARFREMQEVLNAATLPLTYIEGFPALADGQPIWERLEFESSDEYAVFQKYLELPGARRLSLLTTTVPVGMRLSSVFHTCSWGLRAKAHDLFAVVFDRRMREQRILKTTDKHFLKAEELFNKLMNFVPENDDVESWAHLKEDPEKLVKVMEALVKIQRTALGLSVHGNSEGKDAAPPSVEMIMRNYTKQVTPEGEISSDVHAAEINVQDLLANPGALEQAQELILRFGR